eukprot:TRINITY_DN15100_c0_g1_i2.p1 TRINITY_DN15100_c0_g1~~TRINITY_DN15100_c0_g1_i2.p1  ORF type:complete len:1627 (+),score=360.57 TRINITY_DN15100_c0_g1_i2:79-4959(+)
MSLASAREEAVRRCRGASPPLLPTSPPHTISLQLFSEESSPPLLLQAAPTSTRSSPSPPCSASRGSKRGAGPLPAAKCSIQELLAAAGADPLLALAEEPSAEAASVLVSSLVERKRECERARARRLAKILETPRLPGSDRPVHYYSELGSTQRSAALQVGGEVLQLLGADAAVGRPRKGLRWMLRGAVLYAGARLAEAEARAAELAEAADAGDDSAAARACCAGAISDEMAHLSRALARFERRMVAEHDAVDAPDAEPSPVCRTPPEGHRGHKGRQSVARMGDRTVSVMRPARRGSGINAGWCDSEEESAEDEPRPQRHALFAASVRTGPRRISRRISALPPESRHGSVAPGSTPMQPQRGSVHAGRRVSVMQSDRQRSQSLARWKARGSSKVRRATAAGGFAAGGFIFIRLRLRRLLLQARMRIALRRTEEKCQARALAQKTRAFSVWRFQFKVSSFRKSWLMHRAIRALIANVNDSVYEMLTLRAQLDDWRLQRTATSCLVVWHRYTQVERGRRRLLADESRLRAAVPTRPGLWSSEQLVMLLRDQDPRWAERSPAWERYYAARCEAEARSLMSTAFMLQYCKVAAFRRWRRHARAVAQVRNMDALGRDTDRLKVERKCWTCWRNLFICRQGGLMHVRYWARRCLLALRQYTRLRAKRRWLEAVRAQRTLRAGLVRWQLRLSYQRQASCQAVARIQEAGARLRGYVFALQDEPNRVLYWRCFLRWRLYWRWKRAVAFALSKEFGAGFCRTVLSANDLEDAIGKGNLDLDVGSDADTPTGSPSRASADQGRFASTARVGGSGWDDLGSTMTGGAAFGATTGRGVGGQAVSLAALSTRKLQQVWIAGLPWLDRDYTGPLPSGCPISCASLAAVLATLRMRHAAAPPQRRQRQYGSAVSSSMPLGAGRSASLASADLGLEQSPGDSPRSQRAVAQAMQRRIEERSQQAREELAVICKRQDRVTGELEALMCGMRISRVCPGFTMPRPGYKSPLLTGAEAEAALAELQKNPKRKRAKKAAGKRGRKGARGGGSSREHSPADDSTEQPASPADAAGEEAAEDSDDGAHEAELGTTTPPQPQPQTSLGAGVVLSAAPSPLAVMPESGGVFSPSEAAAPADAPVAAAHSGPTEEERAADHGLRLPPPVLSKGDVCLSEAQLDEAVAAAAGPSAVPVPASSLLLSNSPPPLAAAAARRNSGGSEEGQPLPPPSLPPPPPPGLPPAPASRRSSACDPAAGGQSSAAVSDTPGDTQGASSVGEREGDGTTTQCDGGTTQGDGGTTQGDGGTTQCDGNTQGDEETMQGDDRGEPTAGPDEAGAQGTPDGRAGPDPEHAGTGSEPEGDVAAGDAEPEVLTPLRRSTPCSRVSTAPVSRAGSSRSIPRSERRHSAAALCTPPYARPTRRPRRRSSLGAPAPSPAVSARRASRRAVYPCTMGASVHCVVERAQLRCGDEHRPMVAELMGLEAAAASRVLPTATSGRISSPSPAHRRSPAATPAPRSPGSGYVLQNASTAGGTEASPYTPPPPPPPPPPSTPPPTWRGGERKGRRRGPLKASFASPLTPFFGVNNVRGAFAELRANGRRRSSLPDDPGLPSGVVTLAVPMSRPKGKAGSTGSPAARKPFAPFVFTLAVD